MMIPPMLFTRNRSSRPDEKARRPRHTRPVVEGLEGRALVAPLVASANGVTATIGGGHRHYQDKGGWYNLRAPGIVTSMVDSRDPYGREGLFVRLNTGRVKWTPLSRPGSGDSSRFPGRHPGDGLGHGHGAHDVH